MLGEYFLEGGFGMIPVTVFGFAMVAGSVLYALRRRPHHARLAWALGGLTLVAGLLGTATGVCKTAFFIQKVEVAQQLQIFALGLQESLHDLVLASVLVLVGGLVACVGVLRDHGAWARDAA